jgi:hypothetical protein
LYAVLINVFARYIERMLEASGQLRHANQGANRLTLCAEWETGPLPSDQNRLAAIVGVAGLLHVRRAKRGTPSTHPVQGDELRALRRLMREWPSSSYIFVSERGGPMTASNVRKLIARLGRDADLAFPVHPHQLRHACGYALANAGHDTRAIQHWLGHRNIVHTCTRRAIPSSHQTDSKVSGATSRARPHRYSTIPRGALAVQLAFPVSGMQRTFISREYALPGA